MPFACNIYFFDERILKNGVEGVEGVEGKIEEFEV